MSVEEDLDDADHDDDVAPESEDRQLLEDVAASGDRKPKVLGVLTKKAISLPSPYY